MTRKGWFVIPGVQDGYVTLEDQLMALQPALDEAAGKTVLDIGCAEGLISREFARAGAVSVTGMDSILEHLDVAREQCKGLPIHFVRADINKPQPHYSADIVLALGVIHKLHTPEVGLRFASACAASLLLLRSGRGVIGGVIRGKYSGITVDSHAFMRAAGFDLENVTGGPPGREEEAVEYWRKRC